MREIKFRGLTENSNWVYGSLLNNCNNRGKDCVMIKNTRSNINNGIIDLIPEEVLPETVGQYTGLEDKNGVEIYEGDILQINGIKFTVEWSEKYKSFIIKEEGKSYTMTFHGIEQDDIDKVIGNIHDTIQRTTKD